MMGVKLHGRWRWPGLAPVSWAMKQDVPIESPLSNRPCQMDVAGLEPAAAKVMGLGSLLYVHAADSPTATFRT